MTSAEGAKPALVAHCLVSQTSATTFLPSPTLNMVGPSCAATSLASLSGGGCLAASTLYSAAPATADANTTTNATSQHLMMLDLREWLGLLAQVRNDAPSTEQL